MIRSTLRHFPLTTSNLQAMVGWYARVFGMVPNRTSAKPIAAQTHTGLTAAWGTTGNTNHRITLLSICGLAVERQQRPQQITLECASLDELLAAYVRLKNQGIEPVLSLSGPESISFYYDDPDHNCVELTADYATGFRKSMPNKAASPECVDPEKLLAARGAGCSLTEIHTCAAAGQFA